MTTFDRTLPPALQELPGLELDDNEGDGIDFVPSQTKTAAGVVTAPAAVPTVEEDVRALRK